MEWRVAVTFYTKVTNTPPPPLGLTKQKSELTERWGRRRPPPPPDQLTATTRLTMRSTMRPEYRNLRVIQNGNRLIQIENPFETHGGYRL